MNAGDKGPLLRQLRFLVASWKEDHRSDVELLSAFEKYQDEQAFSTLVGRHADLVWGVCLRVLRNSTDAEDAFQATFLRLARDAGRVRNPEALAGWLFRAARCCAIDLRRSIARQRRLEERLSEVASRAPEPEGGPADLRALLDEEIEQLPCRARSVLIMCCLEGRPYKDAALELGCSVAAVHRLVTNARELLRRRLAQKGHMPSHLERALSQPPSGVVPPALLALTVEQAMAFAASGVMPATTAGLIAGAKQSATLVAWLAGGALLFALAALAFFLWPTPQAPAPPDQPAPTRPRAEAPKPGLTVTGVVRGPDGQPLVGARVTAQLRSPYRPGRRGLRDSRIAEAVTGPGGRFRLAMPADHPTWFPRPVISVLASAPGHAPGSAPTRFGPDGQAEVALVLPQARPLRGRILDEKGNPVVGASVEVVRVGDVASEPVLGADSRRPAWAPQAASTADGQFSLPALGGASNVWARIQSPGHALTYRRLDEAGGQFVLSRARVLEVRVREADTGKPVPKASLTLLTRKLRSHAHFSAAEHGAVGSHNVAPCEIDAVADRVGVFRVGLPAGEEVEVMVAPPDGPPPLLGARKSQALGEGAGDEVMVLELPRGRWLTGRVADHDTGRPIAGAVLHWAQAGAKAPEWRSPLLSGRDALTRSGPDGAFRIAVPPGEIVLRAYGPGHDFRATAAPIPGYRGTLFAHFTTTLRVPEKGTVPRALARLKKGTSVSGKVLAPDGSPAERALLLCAGRVSPLRAYSCQPLAASGGSYTVPGCSPGEAARAYLLDPDRRLGAVVDVRAGQPGPTARLAPCGKALVRVLLEDGTPAVGCEVYPVLLVEHDGAKLWQPCEWLDPVNHARPLFTDEQGRAEVPALIPGARHVVHVGPAGQRRRSAPFTAVSDRAVKLPDLRLPPAKRKKP